MTNPEFLYAVEPNHLGEPQLIVISKTTWETRHEWDDSDPFHQYASEFGLDRLTDCFYAPGRNQTELPLTQLAEDPRLLHDQSIL